MSDTAKRDAVRDKVVALQDLADDLHDEIRRLRASVERVRSLHGSKFGECDECHNEHPCPTIRALEETP